MESGETQIERVVETVVAILKEADLEEATECAVRAMAADRLGIDLSDLDHKWIVRRCVESYLLSLEDEEEESKDGKAVENLGPKRAEDQVICKHFLTNQSKPHPHEEAEDKVKQHQGPKQDYHRVICQLSKMRSLAVHDFRGQTLVSFRDYYPKNGLLLPSARGISLSAEQWSVFRKSVPDIEAAITKMESRIRSKDAGKQIENSTVAFAQGYIPMETKDIEADISNSVTASAPQGLIPTETNQIEADISSSMAASAPLGLIPTETNQIEAAVTSSVAASAPQRLIPMETKQIEEVVNSVSASAPQGSILMETKQIDAVISNDVSASAPQGLIPMETKQTEADIEGLIPLETKQTEAEISISVTAAPQGAIPMETEETEADTSYVMSAFAPQGRLPIKTTRLDGKNYHCWVHQMDFFLRRLKIAYVLTGQCPSVPARPKASFEEIAQAKAAVQKWLDDDYICRQSILNCLSDRLFDHYSEKTNSAKELWEELKSAYDEDFGTKRSQVNKYIQFQMVDGISILDQLQELHKIAVSIMASGMWIDENFHVSTIISKLPPSWKEYRVKLMHEEFLPLHALMYRLRVEEESRNCAEREENAPMGESRAADNELGPKQRDLKRPGMHREMDKDSKLIICYRCGQNGHVSRKCRQRKVYIREK